MLFSRSELDAPPAVEPGQPVIAFLLLAQPQFPVDAAVEKLRTFPFTAGMSGVQPSEDGTLTFNVGDEIVAISSVGAPYPENLEEVYVRSWMFPDAAAALKAHAGFVTVALVGGSAEPAQRHAFLTRIMAALSREPGVLGIYWGEAAAVIPADVFIQMTEMTLTENSFPLYLWINMSVWKNEDGTHSLGTTGLNKFGRYEIEVLNVNVSPAGLREYVYGIAHTIILDNPSVKDGMEVGRFGNSVLRAYLKPSVAEGRGTVIQLNTR